MDFRGCYLYAANNINDNLWNTLEEKFWKTVKLHI